MDLVTNSGLIFNWNMSIYTVLVEAVKVHGNSFDNIDCGVRVNSDIGEEIFYGPSSIGRLSQNLLAGVLSEKEGGEEEQYW